MLIFVPVTNFLTDDVFFILINNVIAITPLGSSEGYSERGSEIYTTAHPSDSWKVKETPDEILARASSAGVARRVDPHE
jgi:hypothetical protein